MYSHSHISPLERLPNPHKRPRQEAVQSINEISENTKLSVTSVQDSIESVVTLLERVYAKGVEEVVVTRKDRLCRFGSELVEWIFEKNGTRLVVLGSEVYTNDSEYGELAEDLLAIVTVFVA